MPWCSHYGMCSQYDMVQSLWHGVVIMAWCSHYGKCGHHGMVQSLLSKQGLMDTFRYPFHSVHEVIQTCTLIQLINTLLTACAK